MEISSYLAQCAFMQTRSARPFLRQRESHVGRWVLWEGRKAKTKGIKRKAKDAGHRTVAIRQIAVSLKLLLFLQNKNGNSFIRKHSFAVNICRIWDLVQCCFISHVLLHSSRSAAFSHASLYVRSLSRRSFSVPSASFFLGLPLSLPSSSSSLRVLAGAPSGLRRT